MPLTAAPAPSPQPVPGARLPPPLPLRPPSVGSEADITASCLRCGACVEACPRGAIRPLPALYGERQGTPHIVARHAPCVLCNGLLCTHVCPSGTLRPLAAPDPVRAVRMGRAQVAAERCLPYQGKACTQCHDKCPISGAITIDRDANGRVIMTGPVATSFTGVIDPSLLADDRDMLEDLVAAADLTPAERAEALDKLQKGERPKKQPPPKPEPKPAKAQPRHMHPLADVLFQVEDAEQALQGALQYLKEQGGPEVGLVAKQVEKLLGEVSKVMTELESLEVPPPPEWKTWRGAKWKPSKEEAMRRILLFLEKEGPQQKMHLAQAVGFWDATSDPNANIFNNSDSFVVNLTELPAKVNVRLVLLKSNFPILNSF